VARRRFVLTALATVPLTRAQRDGSSASQLGVAPPGVLDGALSGFLTSSSNDEATNVSPSARPRGVNMARSCRGGHAGETARRGGAGRFKGAQHPVSGAGGERVLARTSGVGRVLAGTTQRADRLTSGVCVMSHNRSRGVLGWSEYGLAVTF
jgi:hypothetical protein